MLGIQIFTVKVHWKGDTRKPNYRRNANLIRRFPLEAGSTKSLCFMEFLINPLQPCLSLKSFGAWYYGHLYGPDLLIPTLLFYLYNNFPQSLPAFFPPCIPIVSNFQDQFFSPPPLWSCLQIVELTSFAFFISNSWAPPSLYLQQYLTAKYHIFICYNNKIINSFVLEQWF